MQPTYSVRDYDFVFCARLVSEKGADVCIRAFCRVLELVPDVTLTVVGDGPERQALEKLVQSLGISEQVRFTGGLNGRRFVTELQRHTCMVVSSLWEETFGIVTLEGIACCETVIVSRRGGLPEAVGDCGLVVEPTDEGMAAAMISVAKARRRAEVLPGQPDEEKRRSHLARHTPEAVTQQYLKVIEHALAPRNKQVGK
jgi:glycosyltransferase involved in cell wall biosynthesis